jgi:hypothetical protein
MKDLDKTQRTLMRQDMPAAGDTPLQKKDLDSLL